MRRICYLVTASRVGDRHFYRYRLTLKTPNSLKRPKKKAARVVVYGSLENDTMDLLSAAFKKKTGLDVDFWRDAANKVTDRVTAESRAGKPLDDVVLTTTSTMD